MDQVQYVTVQTTTDSAAEAQHLASAAVAQRLAACVQISEVRSFYQWQAETHDDAEHLLTLKTTAAQVPGIKELLAQQHSYDEPELIVQPIIDGSAGYLNWIAESTA
ncbi:divalent-cation tolerance protein CutA [Nesterenkonia ebinurensis]|uniref:divalent-cation tolerance protein CutA n=1 Tax=Nesterenkonia ebinurensis TaxID=2608252 RepID=UPI00123D9A76|nr:divalent-cation tolerance protein CutA [Nesterenkonia ebinurensis]